MSPHYRADIDGLRAIAVLSVVLYHAGLPGMSGGFVGVDVFFVISGYLITKIIYDEMRSKCFSIINFYDRRARRILPALSIVIVISTLAAQIISSPQEYERFGASAFAAILFSSNLFFWRSINYFSANSELYPLLHTWSLAVEEQFYIIAPLILAIAIRRGWVKIIVVLGFVTSFIASALAVEFAAKTAFYLLPSRAWEILCGASLALGLMPPQKSRVIGEVAGFLGLCLILVAVTCYDIGTPFPGVAALLPCLGAALIIHSGSSGSTFASRLLSARPLVFIGLVSYSLYLWHWPALAFLRQLRGTAELSFAEGMVVLAFSFFAAILSWRFVERPFRNRSRLSRGRIFAISAASIGVLAGLGLTIYIAGGFPSRLPPAARLISAGADDHMPGRANCQKRLPSEGLCRLGSNLAPASVLLWGDSHAGALAPAVDVVQANRGRAMLLATHPACAPLLEVRRADVSDWKSCTDFNEAIATWLEEGDHEVEMVILAARWALAATGLRAPGELGQPAVLAPLHGQLPFIPEGASANRELMRFGLDATLARLHAAGLQVILLGGVPEIGWNVPETLARHAWMGTTIPTVPTLAEVSVRQATANETLGELAQRYGAGLVQLAPLLCDPECQTIDRGRTLYVDDDHLSFYGAKEVLGPRLAPLLQKVEEALPGLQHASRQSVLLR